MYCDNVAVKKRQAGHTLVFHNMKLLWSHETIMSTQTRHFPSDVNRALMRKNKNFLALLRRDPAYAQNVF